MTPNTGYDLEEAKEIIAQERPDLKIIPVHEVYLYFIISGRLRGAKFNQNNVYDPNRVENSVQAIKFAFAKIKFARFFG